MIEKEDEKHLNHGNQPRFDEFPLPNFEDWLKTVEKSLQGVSLDKLMTQTYEDISIKPIYCSQDLQGIPHIHSLSGVAPFVRGKEPLGYLSHPWEISQELSEGDPEIFASFAKKAMERGQTTLHVCLDQPTKLGINPNQVSQQEVSKNGLSLFCLSDVEKALSHVKWETTPVYIQAGVLSSPLIALLGALFKKQGKNLVRLHGCIGADPIGEWVSQGRLKIELNKTFQTMADTIRWTQMYTPSLQTICVQGGPYHNGGGNVVQELAFSLATAVEYIRELLERELTIDEVAAQIRFSFSTGTHFFMEVAKLRAAKLLWSKIIDAFGGSTESQKMYIHARTSARTKTLFDPYVNILRSTVEAFASIIGGVNSLHVSTFDEVIHEGNEMSRRIARNTQLILDKEAHLSKVVDPAGGSWYIESLTNSIAEMAWGLFQQVEQLGGMRKALINQFPQQEVAKVAGKRKQNMDLRQDIWVGTNMYSNLQESFTGSHQDHIASTQKQRVSFASTYSSRANVDQLRQQLKNQSDRWMNKMIDSILDEGLTLGECYQLIRDDKREIDIQPINIHRTTASFEVLRLASMRYQKKTGSLPKVYLANIGSMTQHKARSDFSQAFFAAGGFQSIISQGFTTIEEATQSILDSGEDIVVICSSDDAYPEWVPKLACSIKKQNEDIYLILAGNPSKDQFAIYKQTGIDNCIHIHSNCFEILHDLLLKKGITL